MASSYVNRRIKIFRLPARIFVDLICSIGRSREGQFYLEGLPEGVEFVAGNFNFASQSIELLIHHSSFDPIAEGVEYPVGIFSITKAAAKDSPQPLDSMGITMYG